MNTYEVWYSLRDNKHYSSGVALLRVEGKSCQVTFTETCNVKLITVYPFNMLKDEFSAIVGEIIA